MPAIEASDSWEEALRPLARLIAQQHLRLFSREDRSDSATPDATVLGTDAATEGENHGGHEDGGGPGK